MKPTKPAPLDMATYAGRIFAPSLQRVCKDCRRTVQRPELTDDRCNSCWADAKGYDWRDGLPEDDQ